MDITILNNYAVFTPDEYWGGIKSNSTINIIKEHKYYVAASLRSTDSHFAMYLFDFNNGNHKILNPPADASFHRLSTVVESAIDCNSTICVASDATSEWVSCYAGYFIVIDLTATFGAGNEPTAAQMDARLAAYPNSWFDGSAQLSTDTMTYTPNSPSPSFPAPITIITGNVGITGADGAVSDTATVAFGSAVCASLPDGTHDTYDAVTGVLTKRVGKFIGSSGTSWTLSDAATNGAFLCDKITAGNLSGQTLSAPSACAPTVYYKLAAATTVQLAPHLPVVRTGIKTLSIGADVAPTLSATVKSMDQGEQV